MRIIDADALQLDYDWSEYDVDGQLVVNGYQAYSESQIENAPTVNAIVIPKDATNLDVLNALFPNDIIVILDRDDNVIRFDSDCFNWLNARY